MLVRSSRCSQIPARSDKRRFWVSFFSVVRDTVGQSGLDDEAVAAGIAAAVFKAIICDFLYVSARERQKAVRGSAKPNIGIVPEDTIPLNAR